MMNCAYHAENPAVVNCNGCGKPLCRACDHRIKGFPFCENCIVTGVELLKIRNQASNANFVKRKVSPFVSVLFSIICPGLGAAYNGQISKALVHFAVFVSLFQLAILTSSPIFVFGFVGIWTFTGIDAWRTAQMLRAGLPPALAEDWIMRHFQGNPKAWAILLIVLGSTLLFQMFFPLTLIARILLPFILIALGVYILLEQTRKNRIEAPMHQFPPSTSFKTGEFKTQETLGKNLR
jgi:hypothetical protein